MAFGPPSAETDVIPSPAAPELRRERVTVRRRRARKGQHRRWVAASRSRRRAMQTFALCAGVLLLMAIGLYFGLSRQSTAPAEGAARGGALGAVGIV